MKHRLLFFGTPSFAAVPLQALITQGNLTSQACQWEVVGVVTQPDRPAGRGQKSVASPVKTLALAHHIPVFQPERLRKEHNQFEEFVRGVGPIDLGVVVAFGQILPKEVLTLPRCGCINIHASLLPRWRGAAPIQRAIMAGDNETGVGIMQMDEGLDTGAVYAERRFPLTEQMTAGAVHDALAELGARLLCDSLCGILSGSLAAQPQSNENITYAHKIESQEASISFERPARVVAAHIRALSPFPGAFTFLQGERVKMFMAYCPDSTSGSHTSDSHASHSHSSHANPGTILSASEQGIEVQCGQGRIMVTELQIEGKKRLAVSEFLRGTVIQPGTRFQGVA